MNRNHFFSHQCGTTDKWARPPPFAFKKKQLVTIVVVFEFLGFRGIAIS